jgi:hypothetical protein
MARAAIFDKIKQRLSSVSEKEDRTVTFDGSQHNAVMLDKKGGIRNFKNSSFAVSNFSFKTVEVLPEPILPFRVRFMNVGIDSYGPTNPPPIGIAIIGFNNYIL